MLKSTILSGVTFMFLFLFGTIAPAQAHECVGNNHNRPDHPHCVNGAPDAGGGAIIVHGGSVSLGAPTVFLIPAAGPVAYRVPRDGTIQNMRVFIESNNSAGPTDVTIFVNGNPTSLSAMIPTGNTADIDVNDTVDVLDGDEIEVFLDGTASTGGGSILLSVSYEIL